MWSFFIMCLFLNFEIYLSVPHETSFFSEQPQTWTTLGESPMNLKYKDAKAYFQCKARISSSVNYTWYYIDGDLEARPVQFSNSAIYSPYVLAEDNTLVLKSSDYNVVRRRYFCEANSPNGTVRSTIAIYNNIAPLAMGSAATNGGHMISLYDNSEYNNYMRMPPDMTYSWYRYVGSIKKEFIRSNHDLIVSRGNLIMYNSLEQIPIYLEMVWKPWYLNTESEIVMVNLPSAARIQNSSIIKHEIIEIKPYIKNLRLTGASPRLLQGDRYELHCVLNTNQAASYQWFKDNKTLVFDDNRFRLENSGRSLMFQSLLVSDIGRYSCQTNLTTGSVHHDFVVFKKASIQGDDYQSVRVRENEVKTVTLNCTYDFGNQTTTVYWRIDDTYLDATNYQVRSDSSRFYLTQEPGLSQLHLMKPTPRSASGMYQCFVRQTPVESSYGEIYSTSDYYFDYVTKIFNVRIQEHNVHTPQIELISSKDVYVVHPDDAGSIFIVYARDHDKGDSGRLQCQLMSCNMGTCGLELQLTASLRYSNTVFYSLHLSTSVANGTTLNATIRCSDLAMQPKSRSVSLRVVICSNCDLSDMSSTTQNLVNVSLRSLHNNTAIDVATVLRSLTVDARTFNPVDIFLSVFNLGRLINEESIRHLSKSILEIFDNLMDVDESKLRECEVQFNCSSTFMNELSLFVHKIGLNGTILNLPGKYISASIVDMNYDNVSHSDYIYFTKSNYQLSPTRLKFLSTQTFGKTIRQCERHVGLALYKNAVISNNIAFYSMKKSTYMNAQQENPEIIVSAVIAAEANLKQNTSVLHPVISTFGHFPYSNGTLVCVYWNVSEKIWKRDGCRTLRINNNHTICNCTHLTNFALLLQVDKSTKVSIVHHRILSTLTYICLTTSCVCLLLTIIIYACYLQHLIKRQQSELQHIDKTTSSKIMISFCIALFFADLIFLASAHHNSPGITCIVIGVLLHYFYLCVFTWSFVEALQLLLTVILMVLRKKKLNTRIRYFFLKASVFAWGVPILIVAATLGTESGALYGFKSALNKTFEHETDKECHLCFLKEKSFYFAFLAPTACFWILNFIVFVVIIVMLCTGMTKTGTYTVHQKKKRRKHCHALTGVAGLIFLLCITWLFGFLQVGAGKIVLQYFFVLSTTIQGAFVLIFYCFFRDEIKNFVVNSHRKFKCSDRERHVNKNERGVQDYKFVLAEENDN